MPEIALRSDVVAHALFQFFHIREATRLLTIPEQITIRAHAESATDL